MNYPVALNYLRQADPILAQLVTDIEIPDFAAKISHSNLLSAMAWAIIGQLISTKAANTIYQRLLSSYGNESNLEAEVIVSIPDEELRKLGISRYKIHYLKNLAQAILDGFPTIAELETMSDTEVIQVLTQLKGIGQWTAQMLLIFRLKRLDILPVDDLGIKRAIQKLYQLDSLPDKKQIESIAQKWQPYRTVACWYLWRSLSDSIEAIKL